MGGSTISLVSERHQSRRETIWQMQWPLHFLIEKRLLLICRIHLQNGFSTSLLRWENVTTPNAWRSLVDHILARCFSLAQQCTCSLNWTGCLYHFFIFNLKGNIEKWISKRVVIYSVSRITHLPSNRVSHSSGCLRPVWRCSLFCLNRWRARCCWRMGEIHWIGK